MYVYTSIVEVQRYLFVLLLEKYFNSTFYATLFIIDSINLIQVVYLFTVETSYLDVITSSCTLNQHKTHCAKHTSLQKIKKLEIKALFFHFI